MANSVYSKEGSLVPGGSKPMNLLPIEPVKPKTIPVEPEHQVDQPQTEEVVTDSGDEWDARLKRIQSKFDQSHYTEEEQKNLKSKGLNPEGKEFQKQLWRVMQDEPSYATWKESLNSNNLEEIQNAYQNLKPEVVDIFRRIGTDLDKDNRKEVLSIYKRQLQEIAHNDQITPEEKLTQLKSISSPFDPSVLDPKSSAEIKQVYDIVGGELKKKKKADIMSWMSDFEDRVRLFTTETERLRNQEYSPQVGREYGSRIQRIKNMYNGVPSEVSTYINENDKRPIDVRVTGLNDRLNQEETKWKMRTYNKLLSSIRDVVYNGGSVDPKMYKKWRDVIQSLTEEDAVNISNQGDLPEGTIKEKVLKDEQSLVRLKRPSATYSRKSSMFDANELMDLYISTLGVK